MTGRLVCQKCGGELMAKQYERGSPEAYDGISEWQCVSCGRRVGRWTGNELHGDELEPRYGRRTGQLLSPDDVTDSLGWDE